MAKTLKSDRINDDAIWVANKYIEDMKSIFGFNVSFADIVSKGIFAYIEKDASSLSRSMKNESVLWFKEDGTRINYNFTTEQIEEVEKLASMAEYYLDH